MKEKLTKLQKESYLMGQMSVDMAQMRGQDYYLTFKKLVSNAGDCREAATQLHAAIDDFCKNKQLDIKYFISGAEFALVRSQRCVRKTTHH